MDRPEQRSERQREPRPPLPPPIRHRHQPTEHIEADRRHPVIPVYELVRERPIILHTRKVTVHAGRPSPGRSGRLQRLAPKPAGGPATYSQACVITAVVVTGRERSLGMIPPSRRRPSAATTAAPRRQRRPGTSHKSRPDLESTDTRARCTGSGHARSCLPCKAQRARSTISGRIAVSVSYSETA